MATRAEALAWFRAQVGATSGRKYWRIVMGYESDADWCAMLLSAGFKATGTDCPYFPDPFAFDKRDLGRIGDRWVEPWDLQAGDPIGFDFDGGGQWGGDHVGIVDEVLGPGYYRTIEGNVSRSCAYRWRRVARDGIIGGIRPRYSDGSAPPGLIVDGDFGVLTCTALQRALQRRGYYSGCLLDGDFGWHTRYHLQRYLRDEGRYGSGYLLDGWFGHYSVLALQEHLRSLGEYPTWCLLDGDWGYYTTCALQRALNDGKF